MTTESPTESLLSPYRVPVLSPPLYPPTDSVGSVALVAPAPEPSSADDLLKKASDVLSAESMARASLSCSLIAEVQVTKDSHCDSANHRLASAGRTELVSIFD
jgi:hypothetical protein